MKNGKIEEAAVYQLGEIRPVAQTATRPEECEHGLYVREQMLFMFVKGAEWQRNHVWHDGSKEEPDTNLGGIIIWEDTFSTPIVVDEYRKSNKNIYYEDGDHCYNVPLNTKGLLWAYTKDILPCMKD